MLDFITIGILLSIVGIVIIMLSFLIHEGEGGKTEVKGGGVLMIGPVPIIFGSDTKWMTVAIVLAIILVALGLLYYLI